MAFATESHASGARPAPEEAFQKWLGMKGDSDISNRWKVLDISTHQEQISLPLCVWLREGYVEIKRSFLCPTAKSSAFPLERPSRLASLLASHHLAEYHTGENRKDWVLHAEQES